MQTESRSRARPRVSGTYIIFAWNLLVHRYQRLCYKSRCWGGLGTILEALKHGWRLRKLPLVVRFDTELEELVAEDSWEISTTTNVGLWSYFVRRLSRAAFKQGCWTLWSYTSPRDPNRLLDDRRMMAC